MSAKVYVGNLDRDTEEHDLRAAFEKYGAVGEVVLKEGFAFILMDDSQAAEDAIKGLHETDIGTSSRVRVQPPRERGAYGGRGGGFGGNRGGGGSGCFNCGEEGHFSRDCTSARRGGGGGRGGGGSSECYNCGQTGHFSRECQSGGSNRRGGGGYGGRGGGFGGGDGGGRGFYGGGY